MKYLRQATSVKTNRQISVLSLSDPLMESVSSTIEYLAIKARLSKWLLSTKPDIRVQVRSAARYYVHSITGCLPAAEAYKAPGLFLLAWTISTGILMMAAFGLNK